MSTPEDGQDFGPRLEVAARTIVSPRPERTLENQDNYLLIDTAGRARWLVQQNERYQDLPDWPQGQVRLAVMDGIGGHALGRQVSEAVSECLCSIPPAPDAGTLGAALDRLHLALRERFAGDPSCPGCTLTLLDIPAKGPAQLFHAGDSRLYEIGPEAARCLTIDQVPATQLALQGRLDEAEWWRRVHEQGGRFISQAFVMGSSLTDERELNPGLLPLDANNLPCFLAPLADRRTVELRPDRLYLLASDGLWTQTEPQTFIRTWPQLLARPERPIAPLLDDLFVELVLGWQEGQHLDNATAVALRVRD